MVRDPTRKPLYWKAERAFGVLILIAVLKALSWWFEQRVGK